MMVKTYDMVMLWFSGVLTGTGLGIAIGAVLAGGQ
jgi:hypothetical protein